MVTVGQIQKLRHEIWMARRTMTTGSVDCDAVEGWKRPTLFHWTVLQIVAK